VPGAQARVRVRKAVVKQHKHFDWVEIMAMGFFLVIGVGFAAAIVIAALRATS
jgi:hypothetical protein